jgi:tRNA(adenine34) deaminase
MHLTPDLADYLMGVALEEAERAALDGEVPIGAVVFHQGMIIARNHNRVEERRSALAHAEVIVIEEASKILGSWRLKECGLVVTVEPCTMCAGAIINSRIELLIFGAKEPKTGALGSLYDVSLGVVESVRPRIITAVRDAECKDQLKRFFGKVRNF